MLSNNIYKGLDNYIYDNQIFLDIKNTSDKVNVKLGINTTKLGKKLENLMDKADKFDTHKKIMLLQLSEMEQILETSKKK